MATLLLRLAGPMQAWGADESKFEQRMTGNMPTKSAVIGMVAAAMGRRRNESISDLASMRFGVRADQVGGMLSDYHAAHHPDKVKYAYITNRQYLEDSCFLVGLESEEELLSAVHDSLSNPYYPLFLGRRACPPSGRMVLGMRDRPLQDALKEEGWLASKWYAERMDRKVRLEIAAEAAISKGVPTVRDSPVSFDVKRRIHSYRGVEFSFCELENPFSKKAAGIEMDAFAEVKGVQRCTCPGWRSTHAGGIPCVPCPRLKSCTHQ